ncbi:MAG: START domain-containing protein [Methylococcales bacterium]|jgi:hypothetical protein|nr:START domain-containing protein [Methylococcales bacterium]
MKHVTLLLLLLSSWQSQANITNWTKALTDEKITVYSRPQHTSALSEFKAVVTIEANIQQAIDLITNTEASSQWLAHCAGTTLLEQPHSNQALVYTVINTPWPLSDRDTVVNFTFNQQANGGMHILMQGKPAYLPKQDDRVRIPKLTGAWTLEPLTAHKVRITYQLSLDPGGNSPAWLVNEFSQQGMYDTLANLRTVLLQGDRPINLAMQ